MAAQQAPLSLGFSRQEHWSGLPFPSPMHESESESEVAQSCPTLSDPMDCSLPGSSIHGIFQARVLECHCLLHGCKINADGDCSHEIKRRFLLGRKAMTNLDSILKSRGLLVYFTLLAECWQRRQWQPTPVLLPGKSHGWQNLVGCSSWGR